MSVEVSSPVRQPFGELGASQLQRLSATKNRQNAITDALLTGKELGVKSSGKISVKRSLSLVTQDDDSDFDSENVDPSRGLAKRAKGSNGFDFVKPSSSISWHSRNDASMSAGTTTPANLFTFTSNSARSTTPPAIPQKDSTMSAPAGRSPKNQRIGILSRKRVSASPFKRIEPPKFGSAHTGSAFSIDAALKGTLSTYNPTTLPKPAVPEAMPKAWFFSIHEDTPDEEAANLMEHSTCVLDLSSDDEEGLAKKKDDRGKENVPPLDYTPQPRPQAEVAGLDKDSMVEDEVRSPLGSLVTSRFYDAGHNETTVELVNETDEAEIEPLVNAQSTNTDSSITTDSKQSEIKILDDTSS